MTLIHPSSDFEEIANPFVEEEEEEDPEGKVTDD